METYLTCHCKAGVVKHLKQGDPPICSICGLPSYLEIKDAFGVCNTSPTEELDNAINKAVAYILELEEGDYYCPQRLKYPIDGEMDVDKYNETSDWVWPECKLCCIEHFPTEDSLSACYKRWFMSKESDKGEVK